MVDEETGRTVDPEHKGRGYEVTKEVCEIDEDELKAIQVESTHTVDIEIRFVPRADFDKRYIGQALLHCAKREDRSESAFVVIRDAMQDEERVALGRIVMAHKEHMIMLEPLGKGLLGTTLRFELRSPQREGVFFAEFRRRPSARTWFRLRTHILQSKAAGFNMSGKFKDEYEMALRKLVQHKAKGHTIEASKAPIEKPSNVINLMDALRRKPENGFQGDPPNRFEPKKKIENPPRYGSLSKGSGLGYPDRTRPRRSPSRRRQIPSPINRCRRDHRRLRCFGRRG